MWAAGARSRFTSVRLRWRVCGPLASSPLERGGMTMRIRRTGVLLSVAGLVVSALAVGVAYATIPDSSGVIHGCYQKSGGALSVIDASVTNCAKTQTSLDWNVQGPTGPQGPQGPQG